MIYGLEAEVLNDFVFRSRIILHTSCCLSAKVVDVFFLLVSVVQCQTREIIMLVYVIQGVIDDDDARITHM